MSPLYVLCFTAFLVSVAALPSERVKRLGIPGGINPVDNNNSDYLKLAQDSFEKYKVENPSGAVEVREIKVTNASYQVVAGIIKRIDFTVHPVNGESFTCHSQVLEPVGNAKKEITVNCNRN